MPLSDLIQTASARHPEQPALITEDSTLRFSQLAERVDAAAALLRTHQVQAGDVVALAFGQTPVWQWVLLLGALRLGAVPAVLGARPHVQLRAITGQPPHLVVPAGSPLAGLPGVRAIPLDAASMQKLEDTRMVFGLPEPDSVRDSAGLIQFGGLDAPRAMRLSGPILLARCQDLSSLCRFDRDSRLLSAVGVDAGPSIEAALAVWSSGGAVVLPKRVGALLPLLRSTRPNRLVIAARALAAWVETAPDATELRALGCEVTVLGGPMTPELGLATEELFGVGPQLLLWGPESGVFGVGSKVDWAAYPGCLGRAAPGVNVDVVGRDGNALPVGRPGLIRVKTRSAVPGYLDGGESHTGLGLRQGWFDTGLVGHLAEDGRLCIQGAAVSPRPRSAAESSLAAANRVKVWNRADLEAAAKALPGVADACVLSQALPDRSSVPVIVYIGNTDDTPEQLGGRVQALLGDGHRFHLIRVPSMPRQRDGSVDRDQLATTLQAALGKTLPQAAAAAAAKAPTQH